MSEKEDKYTIIPTEQERLMSCYEEVLNKFSEIVPQNEVEKMLKLHAQGKYLFNFYAREKDGCRFVQETMNGDEKTFLGFSYLKFAPYSKDIILSLMVYFENGELTLTHYKAPCIDGQKQNFELKLQQDNYMSVLLDIILQNIPAKTKHEKIKAKFCSLTGEKPIKAEFYDNYCTGNKLIITKDNNTTLINLIKKEETEGVSVTVRLPEISKLRSALNTFAHKFTEGLSPVGEKEPPTK